MPNYRRTALYLWLATAFGHAHAQSPAVPVVVPDAPASQAQDGLQIRLGAGALIAPRSAGSDRSKVTVLPYIDAAYGERVRVSVQDGLVVKAFQSNGFSAGPVVRLRLGQKESDDRRALHGLGNVGTSVELGGFVGYTIGDFEARVIVGQDVAGGHKGLVGELNATYSTAVFGTSAGPWIVATGPSLTIVDSRYNRSYFGVDAKQSARSGRPQYRPGGGLEAAGFAATLVIPIAKHVAVTGLLGYNRLLDDAARSPIVRKGGSPNQFSAGGVMRSNSLATDLAISVGAAALVNALIVLFQFKTEPTSPLTPPGWVIGLIWTAIFAALGTAHWLMRREGPTFQRARRDLLWFGLLCLAYPFYTLGLRSNLIGAIGNVVILRRYWPWCRCHG
eukprot:gene10979-11060_t